MEPEEKNPEEKPSSLPAGPALGVNYNGQFDRIRYADLERTGTTWVRGFVEAAPDSLETLDYELDAEVFAHGLDVPWGIAFIGARGALPSLFTYGHRNPQGLGRVRDVAPGPDGTVYVVLNKPHRVLRLVPRKPES